MWIINDEKARAFANTFFTDEEISESYEAQRRIDSAWVELHAYEGQKANTLMKVRKTLFKNVPDYDSDGWNPFPDVKPDRNDTFLVTRVIAGNKVVESDYFGGVVTGQFSKQNVIAFREFPKPYESETNE